MAVTGGIHHYGIGPPKARKKRDTPEARLQKAVIEYLSFALPRGAYRIRAGIEGANRTGRDRSDFHATGGAAGWPDLMLFNRQTRAIRWIELKSEAGRVQASQAAIHADLRDHLAVCRSLEDVEAALISWGLTPLVPINQASRYAVPS
jgi:VRR-NUC domain